MKRPNYRRKRLSNRIKILTTKLSTPLNHLMSITKHKCNLRVYNLKSNTNKSKEKSDFKDSTATGGKISMLPR